jgi:hypothetical protein
LAFIYGILEEIWYHISFLYLFCLIWDFSGDVLSFHVFGQVIVVLNSVQASRELFEKRSHIYSDKPVIPFFDMCVFIIKDRIPASHFRLIRMGWGWFLVTTRYDEYWRRARKLLDRGLRPGAAASYYPMQLAKTRALLTRLLENPSEWEAHIELSAVPFCIFFLSPIISRFYSLQGELILAMTYGYYEASGRNDRRIEVARKAADIGTSTFLPGALLVNDLPFRAFFPYWFDSW